MEIKDKVAVVTGGASGIGRAVGAELARRGVRRVGLVDISEQVGEAAEAVNRGAGRDVAVPFRGDVTVEAFRTHVFAELCGEAGTVSICVPAAGITRDALAVKVDKETGKAAIYPIERFRQVMEVNLIAPIYWAMQTVACIAEDRARRGLKRWTPGERVQGTIIFIGSVS